MWFPGPCWTWDHRDEWRVDKAYGEKKKWQRRWHTWQAVVLNTPKHCTQFPTRAAWNGWESCDYMSYSHTEGSAVPRGWQFSLSLTICYCHPQPTTHTPAALSSRRSSSEFSPMDSSQAAVLGLWCWNHPTAFQAALQKQLQAWVNLEENRMQWCGMELQIHPHEDPHHVEVKTEVQRRKAVWPESHS